MIPCINYKTFQCESRFKIPKRTKNPHKVDVFTVVGWNRFDVSFEPSFPSSYLLPTKSHSTELKIKAIFFEKKSFVTENVRPVSELSRSFVNLKSAGFFFCLELLKINFEAKRNRPNFVPKKSSF